MMKRIVLLRKIQLLIETVNTQISFINTDIISLISTLSINRNFDELFFLKECIESLTDTESFESVWINSVNSFSSPLTNEDKNILISFGTQLGKSDTEGQIKNCKFHARQIENQITEAEEKYKKYGSLYLKLGILSGILILITLI